MQTQTDLAFGAKHGCQLAPELTKRWPLGIDRIRDLWRTNAEGRLLAYLCEVAAEYEPRNNLTQYLLVGPRAFHILHPSNVESLLSTNFKGKLHNDAFMRNSLSMIANRHAGQNMGLASGPISSLLYLGAASLLKRDLDGSIRESF